MSLLGNTKEMYLDQVLTSEYIERKYKGCCVALIPEEEDKFKVVGYKMQNAELLDTWKREMLENTDVILRDVMTELESEELLKRVQREVKEFDAAQEELRVDEFCKNKVHRFEDDQFSGREIAYYVDAKGNIIKCVSDDSPEQCGGWRDITLYRRGYTYVLSNISDLWTYFTYRGSVYLVGVDTCCAESRIECIEIPVYKDSAIARIIFAEEITYDEFKEMTIEKAENYALRKIVEMEYAALGENTCKKCGAKLRNGICVNSKCMDLSVLETDTCQRCKSPKLNGKCANSKCCESLTTEEYMAFARDIIIKMEHVDPCTTCEHHNCNQCNYSYKGEQDKQEEFWKEIVRLGTDSRYLCSDAIKALVEKRLKEGANEIS